MKLKFGFLLILFGLVFSYAQFTVQGKISDFHDKVPLNGAAVNIGNQTAVSDANGFFEFRNIRGGTYTLSAQHPECDPFSQEVNVDRNLLLHIAMEHHSDEIETISLIMPHQSEGSVVISTLDNETILRNSSENLGNLLSAVSGVGTLKTGNNISKPIIHGLYGSRISVINDGVKMAEQEWGVEHAPSIEPTAFEHIDLVKGSSTLKFSGDAVGGIVLLEPQNFPSRDSLMGTVHVTGLSNGRGIKTGLNLARIWTDKWFVKAGGTYGKLGDLYVPHHTLQNTGSEENSFNFSFGNRSFMKGFEIAYSGVHQEFGIFKGSHLGGPEDFLHAIENQTSPYYDNFSYDILSPRQVVNHHIAKMEAYQRFKDFGRLKLRYSFQLNNRKEYDIRRGEYNNFPAMDLRLITQELRLEHLLERKNWQLESGIFGVVQDNFPNPETKARRLIPDYYRYDAGLFSVFQHRISGNAGYEAGIRYDFSRYDAYKYYDQNEWDERFAAQFSHFEISKSGSRVLVRPQFDYHNFSMNAGVYFKPLDQLNVKFNLSRNVRTPNAAELFADGLHHSASIIETGNLAIAKEVMYNANLSLKMKLDFLDGLQMEFNPYFMYSDSFINQLPSGVQSTNRGVFMIWDYRQTQARIFGIDADLQLNFLDNFNWKSQFSTLRGDDLSNNEPLILMMPTKFFNALEFKIDSFRNFYLKAENESVLQQKRVPQRNISLTVIENGQIVNRELDTSTAPSSYTLFHAAAGMDLAKNFTVNFRINNIFNTNYRDYLNRLRYFAPELGRSLILGFKYNF